MNLANAVAASVHDTLVVSPNITITLVNPSIDSTLTPNCPAASATAAISLALVGISLDISLIALLNSENCCSVASTVFLTPANASSYAIAAAEAPAAIKVNGVAKVIIVFPIVSTPLPRFWILTPVSCRLDPNC